MTEPQAYAFLATVQAEFPEKIKAAIGRSQNRKDDVGYIVHLKLVSMSLTLTAYQGDEWQSIKHAWSFFLGIETEEEKPVRHLVGDIPMVFYQAKDGYWRGRYQEDGLTKYKYFGRLDPRPNYPILEEDKVS